MLIKIEDRKYRFVKNQYMSRRRRVLARMAPKLFCGLKAKTWASVVIVALTLAIIETPIVTFGKTRDTLANTVKIQKVWAAQPTPSLPEIAPEPEKEHNINLIKKIWGKDADTGIAIARCESGFRSGAKNYNTNKTWDLGIFQINSVHITEEMLNPTANISYAYTIYLKQGTNPWNSSKHCWL